MNHCRKPDCPSACKRRCTTGLRYVLGYICTSCRFTLPDKCMHQHMVFWYLSHCRATKALVSTDKGTFSPEPSLLAYTKRLKPNYTKHPPTIPPTLPPSHSSIHQTPSHPHITIHPYINLTIHPSIQPYLSPSLHPPTHPLIHPSLSPYHPQTTH